MSLKSLFSAAVKALRQADVPFAVAGGFAAELYRAEPRLTMDIDLAILSDESEARAREVLESIGLHAGVSRKADLDGGPLFAIKAKNTPACLVVGRPKAKQTGEGVDILLPGLPWVPTAVERAQLNQVDYGFGSVPVLTLEDLILSKLYALMAHPPRAKDMDDLQSVHAAGHEVDSAYLSGKAQEYGIRLPKSVKPFIPSLYWDWVR